MCDINKIAALIATACACVLVAVGLCTAAAIAAGTFYGALGNGVVIGIAAGAIGGALIAISAAIVTVGPCVQGACKGPADVLMNWLIALRISLTVLLAALIVGIFATSIPFAGTAVAIALGVSALAIAITLTVVGGSLTTLDGCLKGAVSGLVTGVAVFVFVTIFVLVVAAVGGVILLATAPGFPV